MKERQNRRSREEWERINALWEKDRKPQTLFCKELGIKPSCFRYWRGQLSKSPKPIPAGSPQFAIAKLSTARETVIGPKTAIKIDYPNGIAINLYCELNSKVLTELKPLLEV